MTDRNSLSAVLEINSARCLEYNLGLLDQDSNPLLFDTIKLVYDVFCIEVDVSDRKDFLESIIQQINNTKCDPAALLIFMHSEPDPEMVMLSVWSYLKRRRSSVSDSLIAGQDIMSILEKLNVVNRGAAFAGLICFGDRRICSAARTISDSISLEETMDFSKAISNPMFAYPLYRATLEFCFIWMAELATREKYDVLAHVASAISSLVNGESGRMIQDIQFNFGPYGFASEQTLPEISLDDLFSEFKPLVELLTMHNVPALNELIGTLQIPGYRKPENFVARRQVPTRRDTLERRFRERRQANVTPQIERRIEERRSAARRMAHRR